MKRILNVARMFTMLVTAITFSGCFQYPEGPIFTLQTRDERIEGTWQLTSATDPFGADVTTEFNNITLTVIGSRSGDNSWSVFKNNILTFDGTYQFAAHSNQIVIAYTVKADSNKIPVQTFYTIRKLTDHKLYYVDDNSFTLHYDKF